MNDCNQGQGGGKLCQGHQILQMSCEVILDLCLFMESSEQIS